MKGGKNQIFYAIKILSQMINLPNIKEKIVKLLHCQELQNLNNDNIITFKLYFIVN